MAATAAPGSQVENGSCRSMSKSAHESVQLPVCLVLADPLRGTDIVSSPLCAFQADQESDNERGFVPSKCSGYSGRSKGLNLGGS